MLAEDRQGNPVEAFSPDFYLPAYDLFIEITTLNQKLVTKKNRKVRKLQERYPGTKIKILYQRDYLRLLVKYGLEPPSQHMAAEEDVPELRFDDVEVAPPSASSAATPKPGLQKPA